MPLDFTKHFVAVPTEFKLRNNTGCSWKVTVKLMNGMVTLDQGWATYAAVHQIKIAYMVTFKLLTPGTLKVIIFDDDGIEVINKCGKHDEAFAAKEYGRATSFQRSIESALNMFMVYALNCYICGTAYI